MKSLQRCSRPPASGLNEDVLLAMTMAIALSLAGMTAWLWSGR